jgi:hypothetical protein
VTVSRGPATLPALTVLDDVPPAPARTATAVTADAAMAIKAPMTIKTPRVASVPLRACMMSSSFNEVDR